MTVFILEDGQRPHSFGRLPDRAPRLGLGTPKVVPKVPETGRGWLGLSAMSGWEAGNESGTARDSGGIPMVSIPCL